MTLSHLKTPTAEHPAIRFDEVSKTFPPRGGQSAVAALEGISLNVASGRIVGVIGRSGTGVVCGMGRNPTLRLWPAIFAGEVDMLPSEGRDMGQQIGR